MKKALFIAALILLLSLSNANAFILNVDNKEKTNSEKSTIKGTVEDATTCITNPISRVTVKAVNLNPLKNRSFTDITDSNGEFEIIVSPGSYKISAEKEGYKLTSPRLPYFEKIESGETYEFEFFMIPSKSTRSKIQYLPFFINQILNNLIIDTFSKDFTLTFNPFSVSELYQN